jgi:6-phosphogluconolactonase (cycloisomerase 2 family)
MDDATGTIGTCSAPVTGFTNPTGIAASGNSAYVANFGSNMLSQCTLDATTGLSACADSGVSGLASPVDVVINGSNAYVVNFGGNSVTRCTVDGTTGALSACADTGATGLASPIGIAIYGSVAYVTNNADKSVSQCTIDGTTGNLACASNKKYSIAGLASPYGVAVNGNYLYVVNQGNAAGTDPVANPMTQSSVTRCSIDATTGDVDTASCAADAGFTVPDALGTDWYQTNRIAFKGTFAYLTNRHLNNITQCAVDPTTGALSACVNAAATFNAATGIAIK